MVWFVMFFPVLAALATVYLAKRGGKALGLWAVIATGATLLGMIIAAVSGFGGVYTLPIVHLTVALDGFRCLYGIVVCFMWFVAAMLSPQYFRHHHNLGRYYFFFLLCLSSTVGVFLSAHLYTTFMFFEMMSIGSYVWVAQEETEGAMDAGKTYLTIAVLGGLVTLMGLFLLHNVTGTLLVSELREACMATAERGKLWAAALCIFFGFAAKAGLFPLHIWLPKAHPVAPAPASALLSGVLTKAGIFGVLTITAQILVGEATWGYILLVLGAITMVLGAVIAVFSTNLKYILACSSLSQIGFITVGISMICLLGEENALAANGSVLYMMNHSLVKLVLFLFAGVVYYNTHALDLNDIRGFGRGKPLLHVIFLSGACSLAGIPGFCGYISKTLVHEAIVEYAHHSHLWSITAVEWLFLFSGGLTAAYLTKIYVAVFWQKGKDFGKNWGTPLSKAALCIAAVTLPIIGLTPHVLAEKLSGLTLDFTGGHPFHHGVHYLAWVNLKGVVISLCIAAVVYCLFIRMVLIAKDGTYRSVWPKWLSLEDSVYKPFFRALFAVIHVLCRLVCDIPDLIILAVRKTVLRDSRAKVKTDPYPRLVRMFSRFGDESAQRHADISATRKDVVSRFTGSLSFALLMTCLGLCVALCVMILTVF